MMSISCVYVLEGKLSAHETAFAVLFKFRERCSHGACNPYLVTR